MQAQHLCAAEIEPGFLCLRPPGGKVRKLCSFSLPNVPHGEEAIDLPRKGSRTKETEDSPRPQSRGPTALLHITGPTWREEPAETISLQGAHEKGTGMLIL